MQITGKLVAIMPLQTGTTKAGKTWEKQQFVIETIEEHPKKISFDIFGKKTAIFGVLKIGTEISVVFNVESREYNGKWFTNAIASNVTTNDDDEDDFVPAQNTNATQTDITQEYPQFEYQDDLPF